MFRPQARSESAPDRTELAAVAVNAVNGVVVMAALSLPMLSMFTPALLVLQTVLFGPLLGFVVSSLYSRVEWTVGKRLGGTATLDQLYRLFAWSSIPVALSALLYGAILAALKKSSTTTEIIESIPSIVIVCWGIKNYCSHIIAAQQFTRTRGIVSVVFTLALFLVLIAGFSGFLYLYSEYGSGGCLKTVSAL